MSLGIFRKAAALLKIRFRGGVVERVIVKRAKNTSLNPVLQSKVKHHVVLNEVPFPMLNSKINLTVHKSVSDVFVSSIIIRIPRCCAQAESHRKWVEII